MANAEYLNNKRFETLICRFQEAKRERTKYELIMQDIEDAAARTSKRNKYSPPASWVGIKMLSEATAREYQELQKELASAFYILSENIVRYAKFNLIDPDDAIQEGVMICFEKVDRFDPSRGSKAFNYMTTCILNHFRQLYRTARNYNELKKKYHDFLQIRVEQPSQAKNKGIFKKHNLNNRD